MTPTPPNFSTLCSPLLAETLASQGITNPTEVQAQAIPLLKSGADALIQGPTGTGKTLAYLLPLVEIIQKDLHLAQGLVLLPTQELAVQVHKVLQTLTTPLGLKTGLFCGDTSLQRQFDKLKEKPQVLVGTPGRLVELIQKRKLQVHGVKTLVLDEADRLVNPQLEGPLAALIKSTLKERRIWGLSATLAPGALSKLQALMKDPQVLKIQSQAPVPSQIDHYFSLWDPREKADGLRKLLHSLKPALALVFLNQTEAIQQLTAALRFHGLQADCLHGQNKKLERQKALEAFRKGSLKILICSDLAARGLDLEVTHVFCLDLDGEAQTYQHRCGRTGRNGKPGWVCSLLAPWEEASYQKITQHLGIKPQPLKIHHGKISLPRSAHETP